MLLLLTGSSHDKVTTKASWYSVESCKREGTSGICADGSRLSDRSYTCAIWDYPLGTKLRVRNIDSGTFVDVRVTDRGPGKKARRMGVTLDLSKRAFSELACDVGGLTKGIIEVEVCRE